MLLRVLRMLRRVLGMLWMSEGGGCCAWEGALSAQLLRQWRWCCCRRRCCGRCIIIQKDLEIVLVWGGVG